jgi:DNA-binding NarL/FixJ family response regulator
LSQLDRSAWPAGNHSIRRPWGLPEIYENRFLQALSGVERLTERELEVFALLGLGLANRMIAKDLGVTERTAKAHVCQIFAKLGMEARSEVAVVSFIWRCGLLEDSARFAGLRAE